MDPGHHTAFLLAILVCMLLLVLAVSAFLACYCRRKCFNSPKRRSIQRIRGQMKDQSTSMNSFTVTMQNLQKSVYNGPMTSQTLTSIPSLGDDNCEKENQMTPCMSLNSQILVIGDEDFIQASELDKIALGKRNSTTDRYSSLHCMLSSGASIFSSMLEMGSMLSMKTGRRSSSMKSGVDLDLMLVPMESPVRVTSSVSGQVHAANLPRDPNRSTILCENSSDQPFTWNTAGLSFLSNCGLHKESLSVPGTLERKPCISELNKSIGENGVKIRNSDCSPQQRPFRVPFGNRPLSDGAQVANGELENVASVDSGVDILVVLTKSEGATLNRNEIGLKQIDASEDSSPVTQRSIKEETTGNQICDAKFLQENEELLSHKEAARKLNGGSNGRTLWQKWEERPLIGVN